MLPLKAACGLSFVGGVLIGLISSVYTLRGYFATCLKVTVDEYVKGFQKRGEDVNVKPKS